MALSIQSVTPLLQVFDLPTSLRFYQELLGFSVEASSGTVPDYEWVMLSRGPCRLMLNTAYDRGERPPEPDPSRQPGHADLTLYFACDDLEGVFSLLQAHGWPAEPPATAYYGMRQLYTQDADGYGICFQHPVT